jgi:hypothetical protein
MYTHRTSGVVHDVKRYCYLFFGSVAPRRPNLLQARLGLEDAQPHIPSCPRYRHGELAAHFDVFRDAVFSCENTGGMGAGPS